MWKLSVPLKVKIFLWYLQKGVTPTKDNLLKRNWKGDSNCCFCNCNETIQHHLFLLLCCKFVWDSYSVTNLLGS